jgi:hypothetical protein
MAEEPEDVVAVAVRKRGQVSGLAARGYMRRRGRLGGGDRDQHRGGAQDQRRVDGADAAGRYEPRSSS